MLKITLLKDHPETISRLAGIWYEVLGLFAFDPTIPNYYKKLGWEIIDVDTFKTYPVTVMRVALEKEA